MEESERIYFSSEVERALKGYEHLRREFEEALKIQDPERRYGAVNRVYRGSLRFTMGSPIERTVGDIIGRDLISQINQAFNDSFLAVHMNDLDLE